MLKYFLLVSCIAAVYGVETEHNAKVSFNNGVQGTLSLSQHGNSVTIEGTLENVVKNLKDSVGFHVHEKGEITDTCKEAGGHFNPDKKEHGAPSDENRHAGDLGNVNVKDKKIKVMIDDKVISLDKESKYFIGNRAIVIHAETDDLGKGEGDLANTSKQTGNAGDRIACGKIVMETSGSVTFYASLPLMVLCLILGTHM